MTTATPSPSRGEQAVGSDAQDPTTKSRELVGIDGWLALLVIILLVGKPLFGAANIYKEFYFAEQQFARLALVPAWTMLKVATWVTWLVVALISIYGGIGLARGKEWSVVRRAQFVLWLTGPVAVLIMGVVLPGVALGSVQVDGEVVRAFIVSAAITTLWTAYLSFSLRVRNTYGPPR